MLDNRENYLTRAHDAHQQAMQCDDPEINRRLLGIAKAYRDLAELADSKLAQSKHVLRGKERNTH